MHVELRPLSSIQPYTNNPRLNDAAVDAEAVCTYDDRFLAAARHHASVLERARESDSSGQGSAFRAQPCLDLRPFP